MQLSLFADALPEIALEHHPAEIEAARARGRQRYAETLQAVLGNGAEWEYRGQCGEDPRCGGKCACGQTGLRYLFTIHHPDGRTAILGSSCIETYPGISPAMVERVRADAQRLEEAAEERKRRAREVARQGEVQELLRRWSEACYRLDAACAAHPYRHVAYEVWRGWSGARYRDLARRRLAERQEGKPHPAVRLKQYKRTADALRWLRGKCRQMEAWAERPWQ